MSTWSDGYHADLEYTFGYYSELNPMRLRLAFLNAGLSFPSIDTACELGFGQGLSINIHASASGVQWYGTDFNPTQAGFAQELARFSDNNAQLFEQSFAEFCSRPDLPDFDFIALHGIWSWISDENRTVIIDFLRRKLKPGGIAYISYNTLPGWASMVAMRHLLKEHVKIMGVSGQGIESSLNSALDFSEELLATNPHFLQAFPDVAERIKSMRMLSTNYLVGEYLNSHWIPMHFSEALTHFTEAKLKFACSAYYPDYFNEINITPAQQIMLDEIPDPMFRETVRDFCINRQFRRDYWSKGLRKLTSLEQIEGFRRQRVILTKPRSDIALKLSVGVLGEFELQESIYNPILDLLADHQIKSISQIEQETLLRGINFSQTVQAIMILISMGVLDAAQDDTVISSSKKQTDRLNHYLCKKVCNGETLNYLASPVTGGAIGISIVSMFFLLAKSQGKNQVNEWAQFAWSILSRQNKLLTKNGKTLETEAENIAELIELAKQFVHKELAILDALGVNV